MLPVVLIVVAAAIKGIAGGVEGLTTLYASRPHGIGERERTTELIHGERGEGGDSVRCADDILRSFNTENGPGENDILLSR